MSDKRYVTLHIDVDCGFSKINHVTRVQYTMIIIRKNIKQLNSAPNWPNPTKSTQTLSSTKKPHTLTRTNNVRRRIYLHFRFERAPHDDQTTYRPNTSATKPWKHCAASTSHPKPMDLLCKCFGQTILPTHYLAPSPISPNSTTGEIASAILIETVGWARKNNAASTTDVIFTFFFCVCVLFVQPCLVFDWIKCAKAYARSNEATEKINKIVWLEYTYFAQQRD